MLVTKNFVVLNNPKTGSTFVRIVLSEIYERRKHASFLTRLLAKLGYQPNDMTELVLPNTKMPNQNPDQHGTYEQIPKEYRGRKVLSVVRNPYDRLLSLYEFRHWERSPPLNLEVIKLHFPSFPELSFDQYISLLELTEELSISSKNLAGIGAQTIQFIQMFFKDPSRVLKEMDGNYLASDKFKKDIGAVEFIRQENLNEELASFMERNGFTETEVHWAREHKKENVTTSLVNSREALWTEKTLGYVRLRESLLLRILNDNGFTYDAPSVGF